MNLPDEKEMKMLYSLGETAKRAAEIVRKKDPCLANKLLLESGFAIGLATRAIDSWSERLGGK